MAGAAAPDAKLMAPIHVFMDNFNKGDLKAAAAAFPAAGVTIIDDVPPHLWSGATALDTWGKALDASDKALGRTDGAVAIGKPVRVVVDADHGYVVVPTFYTFKEKGAPMREVARAVFSLQKGANGWLITSWAWAGSDAKPAASAAK